MKGIGFEGLRVLGKPERFARYYYEQGADELIYLDVVASLYGRNSLLEIVERTAREIFIPLTVGGGLRSISDIRAVLRSGADKVSLNTAAIASPELIKEAVQAFGSSTIVVSIEAIKQPSGAYEAYVNFGRDRTGVNVFDWAQQVEHLGAGELLVTSISHEGRGAGFDLELISRISELVSIPVVACGGGGTFEHIEEVILKGKADAVALASMLHYSAVSQVFSKDDEYLSEGNVQFVTRGGAFGLIERDTSLPQIKNWLIGRGVKTRPIDAPRADNVI